MLLAFASAIIAPASASAQNAKQSGTQPSLTLDQKLNQCIDWGTACDKQSRKLLMYANTIAKWANMYEAVANPAIKKYGTAQEKTTIGGMSKDVAKIMKEGDVSWNKIRRYTHIVGLAFDSARNKPSEKAAAEWMQKIDDLTGVFNTESENIFKGGQNFAQYHQTITEILNRIVAELKKNPQTEAASIEIEQHWKTEPTFLNVTQPIKVEPFKLDPTKTITLPPAGKAKGKKGGKQNQQN